MTTVDAVDFGLILDRSAGRRYPLGQQVVDELRRRVQAGSLGPGERLPPVRGLASVSAVVDWSERISTDQQLVLADAQTSGGLLMAVDPATAAALLDDLRKRGVAASRIGTFTDRLGRIEVT